MARRFLSWLHRWAGLMMAVFLVIVGLTGSLLAFKSELEHLITPQLYAAPKPGATPLDLAALADRSEGLVPQARVTAVYFAEPDQVTVMMSPRMDAVGKPYELDFDQLFLDPWTGEELGRRNWGDLSQGSINLIPFIYNLHYELALGMTGVWILGVLALVWTLDCFVGFYLTLPAGTGGFWRRWKPAWLIKWNAGVFRINFDLHRAGGLWVWMMLLVFAWSSVYMNLTETVYTWATRAVLDYRPTWTELVKLPQPLDSPRLNFQTALSTGQRLMADQAAQHDFTVDRPVGLGYQPSRGLYFYFVRSSRDIRDKAGRTYVYFDGDSGALRLLALPTGQYSGNTVTSWLVGLHMADLFGLPYRIFVCALGMLVTMLSVTGIYIWWKKRRARQFSTAHRGAAAAVAAVGQQ
jgi:uncharacterized iron-regulated membrane protein